MCEQEPWAASALSHRAGGPGIGGDVGPRLGVVGEDGRMLSGEATQRGEAWK